MCIFRLIDRLVLIVWPANSFSDLHISKNTRKRCKRLTLTVNSDFAGAIAGVVRQHGKNWFYRPIREVSWPADAHVHSSRALAYRSSSTLNPFVQSFSPLARKGATVRNPNPLK